MVVFEEGSVRSMEMEMGVERRRARRHNFTLPPSLRWGKQRFLRCVKVDSKGEITGSFERRWSLESDALDGSLESRRRRSGSPNWGPFLAVEEIGRRRRRRGWWWRGKEIEEFEEMRERVMAQMRGEAEKMKVPMAVAAEEGEGDDDDDDESGARPWNLRTRRAALRAPNEKSFNLDEGKHRVSLQKALRSRGGVESSSIKQRKKFSKDLSREEIEEDFALMNGTRPSRRPKKRAKIVQNYVDALFPGFWLSEVTVDTYKIPDEPEKKKSKNS
ncbi:hypothetical protein Sjap_024516 [Stephania japonica]|uniref:Uncharacterized protein n=1 Tax=Stephania japonica TaxID=461633 RepID=A0AAP0EDQ4_9MAGN